MRKGASATTGRSMPAACSSTLWAMTWTSIVWSTDSPVDLGPCDTFPPARRRHITATEAIDLKRAVTRRTAKFSGSLWVTPTQVERHIEANLHAGNAHVSHA
ncbi:hypothetical protein GCM10028833_18190 [Glycomyces tarimensis]